MGSDVDSTRTVHGSSISQDIDHEDVLRREITFGVNGIQKLLQELWDIAVTHLSDDAKYLKSCSLICKALGQTARKLLWRGLRLLNNASARLKSLLSEHRDVATFIHTLIIDLPFGKLPRLLVFKNLKSLTLSNMNFDEDKEDNNGIPDSTPPFPRGLSFPAVTELTIFWYDAPQNVLLLHIVACFPSVSFLCIGFYGMPAGGDVPGQENEMLQNIPLALPRLKSLDFKCYSLASAPAFPRTLSAGCDSLECIKVMLLKDFGSELLDFSAVTYLTRLEVDLDLNPICYATTRANSLSVR